MVITVETRDEILAGPLIDSTDAGVTIDVDGLPVFIAEHELVCLDIREAA